MPRPSTRIRPYLVSFVRIPSGPALGANVGARRGSGFADGAGASVDGARDPGTSDDGGDAGAADGGPADGGTADGGWAYPPEVDASRCGLPHPEAARPRPVARANAARTPLRILSAPSHGDAGRSQVAALPVHGHAATGDFRPRTSGYFFSILSPLVASTTYHFAPNASTP